MALFVVKFGGSSLSTPEGIKRAIAIIKRHREKRSKLVLVVSAMGRRGDPYATDTLLLMLKEVHSFYSQREMDLLLSCGEILSAVLMTERLRRVGIRARSFTGGQAGIITISSSSGNSIKEIYPHHLFKELELGGIPVVAGFQGITWDGEVTTLGRGGSDTTATALGAALKADMVEIYTDVEGLMTGDPQVISRVKILERVNFHEACEMSYQGAKVIHSRAIEIAKKYQIPVRVASTFIQREGSIIQGGEVVDRPVTGLASRSDVVFFSLRNDVNRRDVQEVFSSLARGSISLDFINLHQWGISFLVHGERGEKTREILENEGFDFQVLKDVVKVSIIGGGMTGLPGVMARMVESLGSVSVEILQATDSHTTISCLIKEDKERIALRALHTSFGLDEDKKGVVS